MTLDEKTKKEISQLLALPQILKANLEKRKKYILEMHKEKDATRLAARFRELEKMLTAHYDFLKEQLGNLVTLGKVKTDNKEEVVVIIHLTQQKHTMKFEEYMTNIWQQRNLLNAKRDKELVLHELEKAMTVEEHIINEIRIFFKKISAEDKKDVEKFRKDNRIFAPRPAEKAKSHLLFIVVVIIIIVAIIWFLLGKGGISSFENTTMGNLTNP
jgi:hypothetical protein